MPTGDRDDPLLSFNFIVNIQGIEMGFSEISGLTSESNVVEYRNGTETNTVRKLPGLVKYVPIVLKRGMTPNGKDVWKWRKTVIDGKTERRSGTITLLDEAREPKLVWRFYEGWPSKLEGPGLNATDNKVAIESMEISHEKVEIE
jgi:phage tail-like protein